MEIFALTKREQRVVIVIVLALLIGTIAIHYRHRPTDIAPVRSTSPTPTSFDRDEDHVTADDSQ